jgi:hypothetical protein
MISVTNEDRQGMMRSVVGNGKEAGSVSCEALFTVSCPLEASIIEGTLQL